MPKMEIKTIEISKINPAKYNPRLDLQPGDPDYDKLKRSMQEFDLVEPLVWNKRSGNLVGGHQRLKILKEQGINEVEVSVVDLPDSKEKALNIALNKVQGDWDLPKLKDLLQELDTGEFDMDITGFDVNELEDLMTQFYEPDEKDDVVPEVLKEPITKLGDLYRLGEHRLLCGDATMIDDVEKLMDGQKADMVFTDPPYGINVVGDKGNIGGGTKQAPTTKFRKVIGDDKEFNPVFILPYSEKIFIWGGNYFAHLLPRGGRWFVWDKNRPEGLTLSDCELAWSNINGIKVQKFSCTWDGYHKEGERGTRVHPNQKPIKLLTDVISETSKEKDNILDLFGGSGSTLIACEKLNRKCYMMELDEHYCDVIVKRWEDYTNRKAELING